ncbi:class I adenylate-forming enzyme family protein [Clostridium sp. DJ247]|uniref:class I adenylate-forming enzyme family protein n=1 Tax=Clostridium sp. DJ247 TaxID=2726188 RepID=UPI00162AACEA|nr:AMP-binding protein [Clostridium sp. DJ247]MBC2582442.1 long-chain fatty acid--CoA ligase [Clostridium sp. DJ247]
MLIFSGIYKNAEENPSKVCMTLGDTSVTYSELVRSIHERAVFLAGTYEKGEKVIIKNVNPINTVINFLACSRAGLISIPVDIKILPSNLERIVKKINPCCIIDDKFTYKNCNNSVEKKHEIKSLNECLCKESNFIFPNIKDTDIFLGALSSGTTGHNKVIWRDHKSWTSAFKNQSEVFNISYKDIIFLVGSLSYTANLNNAMHILNEGGSIVFSKNIYPKTWLLEIEENNVSSIFMVPAHYRILLKEIKESIPNVNSLLSCGDKLDLKTVSELKEKFPNAHICEYYGASELGHVAYINFRENFEIGSVGKAFPEVQFWVEDSLVWVKSPYIAPDFRPKATVGDMGRIDEQGNLYLLGRKNCTINKGGIKILPYDIEKVLNNHPKILKAVVFGIKHPVKGEEIAAIILPRDNKLTIKEVMEYCKNNLELHYRPQKIKIVKDIKLNLSGKIDKKELINSFNSTY